MSNKKIFNIINYFDFEKVRNVMKALNWTWAGCGEKKEPGIPSIEELREQAYDLLTTCENGLNNSETYLSACGGFEAEGFVDENKEKCYILRFTIESFDL